MSNIREQFPINSEWEHHLLGECRVVGYHATEGKDPVCVNDDGEAWICKPSLLFPIPEPTITIPRKVAEEWVGAWMKLGTGALTRSLYELVREALKEQS